jgi:hypothetical protein
MAIVLQATALVCPAAFQGFLKMTNGYFADSVTGQPFLPHGIAYQTWNRPLGVWQSPEQLRYDLDEMVKMGANAVRVDFVWQHIEEDADNVFKWSNYDLLVQECEKRDIRIFALIGYQWPPNWFPDDWYTMHPPEVDAEGILHTNRWQSDIIGYETPAARAQYAEWISNVCARYKHSKAIAGWIVGNESGYLGLWSGILDGYDPYCEAAFRTWCQTKYGTIAAANAAWGSAYASFSDVKFVEQYRAYGVEGAIWADMVQWREDSIASFTAVGARAAKVADTNHLISYSTVGMQWGEEDWRYHAEDRGKITAVCLASNAPIGFFSVNNYPWSMLGHESQNGHWGVSFTKKVAKVPVLYSETGFTSSETMWPGLTEQRQGPLIRNAMWESLLVGAIGTHIFSWMDRPYITDREKGFGIVYADRGIKPAFWTSANAFRLMEQSKLAELLAGSQDPKPDIGFLWTDAVDSQYNRYECEMQQIAGALERIGYEPNFLNLAELGAGTYTNFKVIILPRNMRVEDVVPGGTGKSMLEFLRTEVLPRGIHVMASADIPGAQDFNGKARAQYVNEVRSLFGVDPTDPGGYEVPQRRKTYVNIQMMKKIRVAFNASASAPIANYTYQPIVWKYNDEVTLSTGGVLWANMDSGRNKGFENSATSVPAWGTWWNTSTGGVSSDLAVRQNWGWQYSGSNMIQMYGDAVMWQGDEIVPFGRYSASAYFRNNGDDPLRNGSYGSIAIEWYGLSNSYLGLSESTMLVTSTPGNAWVKYSVTDTAPSNAMSMVRVIRTGFTNLLANPGLTGTGAAPTGWQAWNDAQHDPFSGSFLGTAGNAWQFWYDGGVYQDVASGFAAGDKISFGGWLYTPSWDVLRNGTKYGVIELEFYNGTTLISSTQAQQRIQAGSKIDVWNAASATAVVPAGANKLRVVVRCNDVASGDGRFFADDIFVRNMSRSGGSLYVDNLQENPAVVVKAHGTGKAAIFLYAVGDNAPDTGDDVDSEPDVQPWKYRFDIMTAMIRNHFGVQPAISVSGTNAYLCLPEYRTASNGAVLIHMKNYMYDTNQANGGSPLTFNVSCPLVTGKPIRAFEQGRIIEEASDGNFTVALDPDGQEILYAYASGATGTNSTNFVVQFSEAPSLVHPFGDKVYTIRVKYDARSRSDLKLKVAFMENGDNGDGVSNEVYQILTNAVAGIGEQWYFMWIPDPNPADADYKSTPDGGKYHFNAWLETPALAKVAQAVPVPTILEWGIRPTNALPSTLTKGQAVTMNMEWEDLGEALWWKNTPVSRNEAYPGRVAVYRSTKTEAQFPGHLAKVNEVCDWLNSLGYVQANPLDIAYDNVTVQGLFTDDFNDGNYSGWTRAAGALNWIVEAPPGSTNKALRAWRIGNDDNILVAGTSTWGAVTVAADVRYNKQDAYYSDIELFPKYVDRNNYYKVGIRNYFGFWRIKYLVRVNGVIHQQGWLHEFGKTNRPGTNVWYNLKVTTTGSTHQVFFNNAPAGSFGATNFPSAKIALGSRAVQLGIWDPAQGYYFIDDDENGMSADPNTNAPPLNMDWGYLAQFFRTLVLPGVYVMNDAEASNMTTWVYRGLNGILATDGGVAMRNETGASDLGRVEGLFGVSAAVGSISNITRIAIGTNDHYVTLDYAPGTQIAASGAGRPYSALTRGIALATVSNGGSALGLIANVITNNPDAPGKVMVFNFGVDSAGQLTNGLKTLAKRAFEWSRNDAYKARIELKYVSPQGDPSLDFAVYVTNAWVLSGTGATNVIVSLPSDGIMTGDGKFYWSIYVYPWDATNAWSAHNGFYSTGNDPGPMVSIAGKGLQILGMTDRAFAGRDWDMWAAYNMRTSAATLTFGIKDKGGLQDEDNFNDGDFTGWNVVAYSNVQWTVASSALQARVSASPYGYAYIYRNGLNITGRNVTIEYDALFTNAAFDGGLIYRGRVLYVSPNVCGWADDAPNFVMTNRPATGRWNHVVVNIRDGAPYLRSDLSVNGKVVFVNEPIQSTSWTTNTFGFLSPYSNVNAAVQWDNVRIADEQYSITFTNIFGEYVPNSATNPTFWPSVPDYDPDMLEHDGTSGGAKYEWYIYARGEGMHTYKDGEVFFTPRLMVELPSFPTNLTAGTNVVVPVQWENLASTQVPARLRVRLFEAYSGVTYLEKTSTLSTVSGTTNVPVTVPAMPAATSYVWSAFIHATNAVDPWKERAGSDDTYRFNESGIGIQPETMVRMQASIASSVIYSVYSDAGIPVGGSIYTWNGGAVLFNGNYAGISVPEGSQCFMTTGNSWQGWGVFRTGTDLRLYSNGYLKLWVKSEGQLKLDLEGPQTLKRTQYLPSTTNQWLQFVLPITNFSGVVLSNMYGLFEITAESAATFYVDDVRWDLIPGEVNKAPVVGAGSAQTITLPATAALAGTATDDGLPSNKLTVAWSKFSGPGTVTFGNATNLATTASFSTSGVYVLRLTASDTALSSFADVAITVNAAAASNAPPAVNAGVDQAITLPAAATLAGTASDDGQPSGILNVSWVKVSGPGTVTFTNAATANTRASFSTQGVYVLRLTASDTVLSTSDDVQVTVNPLTNGPPTVNAGVDQTITLPSTAALAGTVTDDGRPSNILTAAWSKLSGPGTVTFTNAATANTRASFSTSGVYVLRLIGNDSALSRTDDVQVTVNPVPATNAPPSVNAGTDQTITLPASATLSGTASDDGHPSNKLTVTWSKFAGPGTVTFGNATNLSTTASFSTQGVYVLRLVASDTVLSRTDDVQVTVNPLTNGPPAVNAGVDQTITLPSTAALAGTVTDDGRPSNILTAAWSKLSGPGTVTFTNAATANTRASFSTSGVYVLRLIGNDSALSRTDDVQVTVNPVPVTNTPPVVSAGPDQAIVLPAAATLAGSASDDGLPSGTLTVTWSKVSGPGTVTFTNAATANTRASFSTSGVYVLRLIASDTALSRTDDVQVIVSSLALPPIVAGNSLVLYAETAPMNVVWGTDINTNQPPSSPNELSFTNASAGEGTQSFKIKVNSNVFDVNFLRYPLVTYLDLSAYSNGTLNLMIKATAGVSVGIHIAANYDIMVHLTNGMYGFTTNGGWCSVSIPMSDYVAKGVNLSTLYGWVKFYGGFYEGIVGGEEYYIDRVFFSKPSTTNAPPTVNAGVDQTITLPATAALAGTASDDGLPSNKLTVAWSKVSGPGTVAFANATNLSTTASFSTQGVYVLRLTASDTAMSRTDDVQVTVNPLTNGPPAVNAGVDQTITLPATAALAGTVTDDGRPSNILTAAWSKLSGPGTVTFTNAATANTRASFSTNGVYVLRLIGSDSALSRTDDVQVTVNPVPATNAPPTVNAGVDQTITLPATAALAGTASDDGRPTNILTVAWSKVSGPGTVAFTNAATANTRASFSTQGVYVLRLTASDTALSRTDDVQVTVNPLTNGPPSVNAGVDQTITLPATAALAGTASDDGRPTNILTVAWSKVSGPGTVTFTNTATANTRASFSTQGVYVLRLTASDTALSRTDDVQVTVNPLTNGPPTVNAGVDQTITLPATAALAGTASDDGRPTNILTVAWSKFSGPGTVTFTNTATANTRASFSTQGVYVLRLTASDTALSRTDDVQVTVNPLTNGPPTVNAGVDQTITLPATAALAGTASDDGRPTNILTVAWSKFSGPGTVTFTNAATANTRASFSTNGVYVLRLVASDSALSRTDDVQVTVNPATNAGVITLYADAGTLAGSSILTWQGGVATFNGTNYDAAAPEGTRTFATSGTLWQGWGIFAGTNLNLTAYSNGYLKFWAKSMTTLKIDLEGPATNKGSVYIPSTTNQWAQFILPIRNFGAISLASMYGLFEVTAETPSLFYIDNVRWDLVSGAANAAPAVNAGPDLNITLPTPATLNGTATDDNLPSNRLTVAWAKVSGPGTVTFTNAATANTRAYFSTGGVYVLRLTASDTVLVSTDEVQVIVSAQASQVSLYSDAGIPAWASIYTWQGGTATFNGDFVTNNAPEGSKVFLTAASSWGGWGVFATTGGVDMTEYRDGFIRFWLKSAATIKVDVEQTNGTKFTTYVPTTSNAWKEIAIAVSSMAGLDLRQVKGLIEISTDTAGTYFVDDVRWTKGIVQIYGDTGIPANTRIVTSAGGAATFNERYADGGAPEGVECYFTTGATWAGWSVVTSNGTLDLSLYTNGYLAFWARSSSGLKVEVEAPSGTVKTTYIPSTTSAWKEVVIPLSTFGGFNHTQVRVPFRIASTSGVSYLIDHVRWLKGTNAVPSEQKSVFYSDAGIPAGTGISVWWATSHWAHLSSTINDGGLESSTAGSFPGSGYWTLRSAGAGSTAQCSTLAVRIGTRGLRAQTASVSTSTWVGAYQERTAYAGDIFRASGYLRQPTGQAWVAGSTGSVRLQFLDAWKQAITTLVSATKVTTAGQGWTLCSIPDSTAPMATRYVRFDLQVQKPTGSNGVSVADFDDGWLGQANSFNANFTEDPLNPEGTKCFRSYLVDWSGWGIFYTNGVTTNLSQYAGGYLKFWYKSFGYTKIEIQSVWGGVTNKAAYPAVGYMGPTLNGSGQIVWQQKVIPVSAFAGVDLQHVKSPFMVTDPEVDRAFYVDHVRYTLTP